MVKHISDIENGASSGDLREFKETHGNNARITLVDYEERGNGIVELEQSWNGKTVIKLIVVGFPCVLYLLSKLGEALLK